MESPKRGPAKRSQSLDVIGRSQLLQSPSERELREDSQRSFATARWWLSEAKRMREEALKMRRERDRFRVAVEDAHFECRRLTAQVQEFQSQLKHTQNALRESKTMADAARRELERLRHWINEAHGESRRLSIEVQEYECQLRETRLTLDEAERSCLELKDENESKHSELVKLKEQVSLLEDMGDIGRTRDQFVKLHHDVEDARDEARRARRELKATLQKEGLLQKELDDAQKTITELQTGQIQLPPGPGSSCSTDFNSMVDV